MRFALNHIAAPTLGFPALAELAHGLGITEVEIRNDLAGVPITDGTPAGDIRAAADAAGVTILTINALQRFEQWNAARAEEAAALAGYAAACGAEALVLCPTNSVDDTRTEAERAADLRAALTGLAPILAAHGLTGYVEPLGFAECALRRKRLAIDAMDATGTADQFRVLHDTFHHFLAGETDIFPTRTGLVHISGVEDRSLPMERIRDEHRVLVGPADLMDNAGQIAALQRGGYTGVFSFEPFSPQVHRLPNIRGALLASMGYLNETVTVAA